MVLQSCHNRILNELNQYYVRNLSDQDLRPPELNASGLATSNLTLLSELEEGSSIYWETSEHSAVNSLGELLQPSFGNPDITAQIHANVQYKNGKTSKHSFTVTVPALVATDSEAVNDAASVLMVGYPSGESASGVSGSLSFPSTGLHGTTIVWDASAHPAINDDGSVVQPSFSIGNQTQTVVATITRGGESTTVSYTITVLAQPITDAESVSLATTALTIQYQSGDSSTSVTGDMTFTLSGLHGTTVAWNAGAFSAVANSGVVIQPTFTAGNQSGDIIATVSKGSEQSTKNFSITVIALAITDAESVSLASSALAITYSAGDSATNVTGDLTLPVSGLHGTTVSWDASALSAVTDTGQVTQPSFSAGNQNGNLTATISKGSQSQNRAFTITVISLNPSDAQAVDFVSANALDYYGFADGDSTSSVTQDLNFSSSGPYGTSLSLSTNLHPRISPNGAVDTSPGGGYVAGDTVRALVNLVIQKGSEARLATYYLTVVISDS